MRQQKETQAAPLKGYG